MKHVLKFVLQTLMVVFVFTPVVIGRFIWNFKWNDNFDGLPRGIYHAYSKSYVTFVRNVKGLPTPSTF